MAPPDGDVLSRLHAGLGPLIDAIDDQADVPELADEAELELLLALLSAPAAAQAIKIATLAPDGSAWMRELRVAAAEVKAGTDGRVDVKFYPGGVMGNDAVVLRKMRLGQLQGGVLTSSELSLVYPDADEDWAVDGIINAMRFTRQSQSCTAGSRMFLHEDIFDSFLKKLEKKTTALRIGDPLDEAERAVLLRTLEQKRWHMTQVAAQLGVSRNTLYRKLRRHGIARHALS